MKKLYFLFVLTLISGCGSLRISPQNCKSNAFWSPSEIVAGTDTGSDTEIKKKEALFIFFNTNLRIQELLSEYNTSCGEIKKLRLEIKTTFFFWREVNLIVEK